MRFALSLPPRQIFAVWAYDPVSIILLAEASEALPDEAVLISDIKDRDIVSAILINFVGDLTEYTCGYLNRFT